MTRRWRTYEAALGLFRAVGDRLGEANVLKAQGDVLAFQKRNDEALAKYEAALGLFRAVGARLGEANVLKAQGDVLAFQDGGMRGAGEVRGGAGAVPGGGCPAGRGERAAGAWGTCWQFRDERDAALEYVPAAGLHGDQPPGRCRPRSRLAGAIAGSTSGRGAHVPGRAGAAPVTADWQALAGCSQVGAGGWSRGAGAAAAEELIALGFADGDVWAALADARSN